MFRRIVDQLFAGMISAQAVGKVLSQAQESDMAGPWLPPETHLRLALEARSRLASVAGPRLTPDK